MFSYQSNGRTLVQHSLRIKERTAKVLKAMQRSGGYTSLNALISSILDEIAQDEIDLLPNQKLDESKLPAHTLHP